MEQDLEGGQQQHEERHRLGAADRPHIFGEARGQGDVPDGAAVRRDGRARPVGRQIEHREPVGELLPPVGEPTLQHFALQPLPLPAREVRVLDRQFFERRRAALGEGFVDGRQLAHQHARRPPVRDDVMHRQEQRVVVVSEAQQLGAQQRAALKVERRLRFFEREALGFRLALAFGPRAQVDEREPHLRFGGDDLTRATLDDGEGRAQDFVTADDLVDAAFERRRVERAAEAHRRRDVVGGAARHQLVEEPEALLYERERQLAVARHGARPRGLRRLPRAARGFDAQGERGHRPRLEELAQRQLHVERLAHARDDLRGEQRVAAEVEEVVVRADARVAEHLAENPRQQLLDGAARRDETFGGFGARAVGRGQAPPIDFTARRQRQLRETHEGRRHHVLRQTRREIRAQTFRRRVRARPVVIAVAVLREESPVELRLLGRRVRGGTIGSRTRRPRRSTSTIFPSRGSPG